MLAELRNLLALDYFGLLRVLIGEVFWFLIIGWPKKQHLVLLQGIISRRFTTNGYFLLV